MRKLLALLLCTNMLTALVGAQTSRSWSDWLNGRAFSTPGATTLDQFVQAESAKRIALGKGATAPKGAGRFKLADTYTVPARLANSYASDPADRVALAKRLTDGLRSFAAENKPADVADAFSNLFIIAYTIARKNTEIADTDEKNILRQFRSVFEDAKVRLLPDGAKQEYYEWCVCMGDLLYSLYVSVDSHDRRAVDYVKSQAASLLKRLFKTEAFKIKVVPGDPYPVRLT